MMEKVSYVYFRAPDSFLWKMFQSFSRGQQKLLVVEGLAIYIFVVLEEVVQINEPAWLRVAQFLSGKSICKEGQWRISSR